MWLTLICCVFQLFRKWRATNNHLWIILLVLMVVSQSVVADNVLDSSSNIVNSSNSLRHLVPQKWWEKVAGVKVVSLKKGRKYRHAHEISIDPKEASQQLDKIKGQGFGAIEIFAPAEGLYAYNGLDTRNHYRIDPEIGTMDDFRQLVRIAHSKGLAVIVFYNLGYFSLKAPEWIKACKDKSSEEAKWFWWADDVDAPSPPENSYFNWSKERWGEEVETWGWQYSDLADCYYWSRWRTRDNIGLPQTNWANEEWPKEVGRIVRFWMDTGLDGMIIDAPIFYAGCTWGKNNRHITDVIASYGNTLRQPEAARSVAWIIRGGYNCLQDYGLHRWNDRWHWDNNSIMYAIKTGDPRPIEKSLHFHHDVVVSSGGVLYQYVEGVDEFSETSKRHLERATVAAIGEILVYNRRASSPDAEETWILKTKRLHPALQQLSTRRKLETNADDKFYAFLRTAADKSERILVVLNFQGSTQSVKVNLSGISTSGLIDLRSCELIRLQDTFKVELPPYGYRFYQVLPKDNGNM